MPSHNVFVSKVRMECFQMIVFKIILMEASIIKERGYHLVSEQKPEFIVSQRRKICSVIQCLSEQSTLFVLSRLYEV